MIQVCQVCINLFYLLDFYDGAALRTNASIHGLISFLGIAWVLPHQEIVYRIYMGSKVQIFVAILILLNFLVSAIKASVLPDKEKNPEAYNFFYANEVRC